MLAVSILVFIVLAVPVVSSAAPRVLCSSQLGTDISEAEAKEAVRILDDTSSGYIQFADFAEWYMGRRPRKEQKEAAAQASQ